jgi:DNA-directed RNA polymerase sigma subunit (sigma70/sigma32)
MELDQQPSMQFLTAEESAKVDAALLSSPEKFLTRLTVSSLRLLKHIAEDYGMKMEDLTAEQVVAWFEKDGKIRREQGLEAAFLKW